jgi:hypothetical protein
MKAEHVWVYCGFVDIKNKGGNNFPVSELQEVRR